MEIIFNKLTYIENKRSAREIVYLNDVKNENINECRDSVADNSE